MMVTSAQHVVGEGDAPKIIQTSRSGFSRLFAGLRRCCAYRWYEVEGASF